MHFISFGDLCSH